MFKTLMPLPISMPKFLLNFKQTIFMDNSFIIVIFYYCCKESMLAIKYFYFINMSMIRLLICGFHGNDDTKKVHYVLNLLNKNSWLPTYHLSGVISRLEVIMGISRKFKLTRWRDYHYSLSNKSQNEDNLAGK